MDGVGESANQMLMRGLLTRIPTYLPKPLRIVRDFPLTLLVESTRKLYSWRLGWGGEKDS